MHAQADVRATRGEMLEPSPCEERGFIVFSETKLIQITAHEAQEVRGRTDIGVAELTEEELILTPAVVYGFSFADKIWRECFYDASHFSWSLPFVNDCSRVQR